MQITPLYSDTTRLMKILVLASGRGTNFEKIHSRQMELEQNGGKNYGTIEHVFSNDPEAPVLAKAKALKIETSSINSEKFFKDLGKPPSDEGGRVLYDSAVISLIEEVLEPDLVVLAGYRRRLSRMFTDRFANRILNLYPGDTTKDYLVRGKIACVQALENGEKTIRCTVYLENNPETRFGTVIAQSADISLEGFAVGDVETMEEKIREQGEWKLFPFVVHDLIANGRVAIDEKNSIYVDGQRTGERGFSLSP
ncbi:MAG: formyltransferase family protein [Candidatus Dadabacteria bacterium]|nr:formyltransferase family protein [Candidatus Dadabacteria bacterium]